jgi:hypothetical protein
MRKNGAVTLIQRFGSALNLNIHFHMLFLEGAISENPCGGTTFPLIKGPSCIGAFTRGSASFKDKNVGYRYSA